MLIYSKPCWSRTVDHEPWTRCKRIILGVYYIWCKIFNRLAWIWLSEFLKVPIYQYICLTFCDGLDLVKATFRQDTQSNVIRLQHRLLKIKYVMKMEPKLNLLRWYTWGVYCVWKDNKIYVHIILSHKWHCGLREYATTELY